MHKILVGLCAALGVSSAFAGWTYNPKTYYLSNTESDWVFRCTYSGTSLTMASVVTAGNSTELDLTDIEGGYSLVAIGTSALKQRPFTKVTLPDSITSLGNYAFQSCTALTSIKLPASLDSIGTGAFLSCTALPEINLPSALRTIGISAFESCTSLKKVTPLLPPSVTSLDYYAFRYCSALEGDVVFGTSDTSKPFKFGATGSTYAQFFGCSKVSSFTLKESCFATTGVVPTFGGSNSSATTGPIAATNVTICSGATELANYVFRYWPSLKTVVLPDTLTTIGEYAFNCCTKLETVTGFLPANVSTIKKNAFDSCPALMGEMFIATNPAVASLTIGGNAIYLSDKLEAVTYGKNVTSLPSYAAYKNAGIRRFTLLGNVNLASRALATHNALKEVQFYGSATWTSDTFMGLTNYQTRFVIPEDEQGWLDFCASSSKMTPASAFTAAETNNYNTAFPDGPFPIGYTKVAPAMQWIVVRKAVVAGKHPLAVRSIDPNGAEISYGATDPASSTTFDDVTLPFTCTASEYVTNNLTLVRCSKYVVESYDSQKAQWVNAVTNSGRSYTHNPPQDSIKYRLSWIWEPVAYRVQASVPADIGEVKELSSPDLHGFYTIGSTVQLEAKNGEGTFIRWYGAVAENQVSNKVLSVVCGGAMTVYPYFRTNWTYANNLISDGYWKLRVTADGSNLTINSVAEGDGPMLDLRKPISDGSSEYALTAIAAGCFKQRAILEEVTLPDSLASIGDNTFSNSPKLKKVTPFLPENLSFLGYTAFYQDFLLEGDLRFATGKKLTSASFGVHSSTAYGQNFDNCYGITSATFGAAVASLPPYAIRNVTNLRMLTFMGSVQLSAYAFAGCTEIKEIQCYGDLTWQSNSFGMENYKCRFVVPCENASWQAYYTDTTKVKPYKDLTDAEKDAYTTAFPDGTKPYGLIKASPANEWLVLRRTGAFTVILR